MAHKLDRLQVKGFKSIREIDLELNDLNVLIGANGAGKTNFISLFTLLRQITRENLQLHIGKSGGANAVFYFGQQVTDQLEISLTFGRNGYDCILVPAAGDTLIFGDEKIYFSGDNANYKPSIGSGHKETRLHQKSPTDFSLTVVLGSMTDWRVYHFHDTSPTARLKQTGNINDNVVFHSDASNLAAFLYLLKETQEKHYRQIIKTVRMVAPFFDDFVLRPTPENERKILLEWREQGSDVIFDASFFSDGTLRFICLATLLLQPQLPATILIDEPELGLHPYAITLLAALLKSAATKTQIIVSTQSVSLVDQFAPEDIIVVDRTPELHSRRQYSTFAHLSSKDLADWLEDYSLGDLWQKNILGGRPK